MSRRRRFRSRSLLLLTAGAAGIGACTSPGTTATTGTVDTSTPREVHSHRIGPPTTITPGYDAPPSLVMSPSPSPSPAASVSRTASPTPRKKTGKPTPILTPQSLTLPEGTPIDFGPSRIGPPTSPGPIDKLQEPPTPPEKKK